MESGQQGHALQQNVLPGMQVYDPRDASSRTGRASTRRCVPIATDVGDDSPLNLVAT